jgi:hypothetical protein
MLRHLLDTNICIDVIKRRPQELLDTFNHHAGQMAISAITFSELINGVEKSAAPAATLPPLRISAAVWICWPMAPRPLCITGRSVPPWSEAAHPSASMTSTSLPMPAARGWRQTRITCDSPHRDRIDRVMPRNDKTPFSIAEDHRLLLTDSRKTGHRSDGEFQGFHPFHTRLLRFHL